MTPHTVLQQRGLDSFWVETHRDRAQRALNEADRYAFKAELAFDAAAYYQRDLDPHWFEHELHWAFEYLTVARRLRRIAKHHALMAVRGVELANWPRARAELAESRRRMLALLS